MELPLPAIPSQMHPKPKGGRFLTTPSRSNIITLKKTILFDLGVKIADGVNSHDDQLKRLSYKCYISLTLFLAGGASDDPLR